MKQCTERSNWSGRLTTRSRNLPSGAATAGCIRRRIAQGGLQVRLASGNGGELFVHSFLFLQSLLQRLGNVAAAKTLGPGDQRAVARDLVVIHGMAGHDERLEQVFQMLGKKAASVDCPAIDGIIDEAEDGSGDVEDKDLLDAAIWWGGQCLPQQRGPAAQLILHRPHFVGTSSARGRCSEVRNTRCGC